jgi:hypothetical protein
LFEKEWMMTSSPSSPSPAPEAAKPKPIDWLSLVLILSALMALVYLSDTSLYWIRGLSGANLDVALLLTPLGMVKNLWLGGNHALQAVYDEPALRHGIFQDPGIRTGVSLLWGFAIGALYAAYHRHAPHDQPPQKPLSRRRWRAEHGGRDFGRGADRKRHPASDPSQDNNA